MSIFKSLKIKVLSQISRNSVESQSYLKETFDLFTDRHSESLERLKTFRDKIGAHSDSNVNIKNLPSHAEFETLSVAERSFSLCDRLEMFVKPMP